LRNLVIIPITRSSGFGQDEKGRCENVSRVWQTGHHVYFVKAGRHMLPGFPHPLLLKQNPEFYFYKSEVNA